jgi:hypothetical protein
MWQHYRILTHPESFLSEDRSMAARSTPTTPLPLSWPLASSLLLTAATVALVCERPVTALHSWGQIFSRATLYLLVAGFMHMLAVWGVCRVRDDSEDAGWARVWRVVWAGWIVVVWLPLIALLTSERSSWVAIVLPVTAIFGTLLLRSGAARDTFEVEPSRTATEARELFYIEEAQPLWRVLLPAMFTAIAAQIAFVALTAHHNWTAGCLLGAAAVYPVERWMSRSAVEPAEVSGRRWRWTSAGNSLVVWLMLVLALIPFLAMYAAGAVSGLLGIRPPAGARVSAPSLSHSRSIGYSGVILFTPHKPREIVMLQPLTATGFLNQPREITFDGAYWFFKDPDTRPQPNARIAHGDPIKNRVRSTDMDPLLMEAHQSLGKPIAMSCCNSLRVNVTNADNVPGTIAIEVLIRDTTSRKNLAVSLGTAVLASSTVSPMPLKRAPVEDSVTFQMPRGQPLGAKGRTFNEITVRLKPERSRSLASAQVAIKNFVLQP